MSEIIDTKRASFVKVADDMARQMDMDHNSRATLMRTADLNGVHGYIQHQQQAQMDSIRYNDDLTRRQVEINNWYYENKRETLFVLQLVLLVVLFVTIILVLVAQEFIAVAAGNYLITIILLVGTGVWLYRWYFTKYVRDPVLWNRRQFSEDGNHASATTKYCVDIGDGVSFTEEATPSKVKRPE